MNFAAAEENIQLLGALLGDSVVDDLIHRGQWGHRGVTNSNDPTATLGDCPRAGNNPRSGCRDGYYQSTPSPSHYDILPPGHAALQTRHPGASRDVKPVVANLPVIVSQLQ